MKPDQEDPESHTREVPSEDQWEQDETADAMAAADRPDRQIPQKQRKKGVVVKRHESRSGNEDGPSEGPKRVAEGNSSEASETDPADTTTEGVASSIPSAKDSRLDRSRVSEISPKGTEVSRSQKPEKFSIKDKEREDKKAESEAEDKKAESDGRKKRRRIVRGERTDWGEKDKGGSWKWMAYAGAGIAVCVILALVMDQRNGRKMKESSDDATFGELVEKVEPEIEEELIEGVSENLTKGQEKAAEIYARFATAKSIEDFEEILLRKDEVKPLLEKHWEPLGARENWTPGDQTGWSIVQDEDLSYAVLSGTGPDFTGFLAYFKDTGSGLKLDWKATSGYGSSPFEVLKKGEGNGEEIRTYLSTADFYTIALPDDKFKSFRLKSPDEEVVLWGYVELGSELAEELEEVFAQGQITGDARSDLQVTVRLERGPEDSFPNQWILKDLVNLSWVEN